MVLGNISQLVSYGVFSSGFSQEEMSVASRNSLLLALMLGNKRIACATLNHIIILQCLNDSKF